MRFVLPATLLDELRAWRASRASDEVEERHDAFCLDPGLGPAWYLTSDGRVLRDGTNWDDEPLREAVDAEACQTIVVGAAKTKIIGLLDLLPVRPNASPTCARCHGHRYASVASGHPESPRFVCSDCNGLGWTR